VHIKKALIGLYEVAFSFGPAMFELLLRCNITQQQQQQQQKIMTILVGKETSMKISSFFGLAPQKILSSAAIVL